MCLGVCVWTDPVWKPLSSLNAVFRSSLHLEDFQAFRSHVHPFPSLSPGPLTAAVSALGPEMLRVPLALWVFFLPGDGGGGGGGDSGDNGDNNSIP